MFGRLGINCSQLRLLTSSKALQIESLVDSYGRRHDYLRVSLTDRCNLRCRYCMPEVGINPVKQSESLQLSELRRITKVFVELCGVKKIRLTGGEPMIDKKLVPMLEHLTSLRSLGLETVAMTTNGIGLSKRARLLKDLGLNRINISLDTLKPERFETISRRKGWSLVIEGLKASIEANFERVKLNCVVMKGFNDDEIESFARLAVDNPIEVRFIEFMPMGGNKWAADRLVPNSNILGRLLEIYPNLRRVEQSLNEVSRSYKDPSMQGAIGLISTMSDNFCSGCNRLRLTSDGYLKVCLFGKDETSLRDLMRNGATNEQLVKSIASALHRKKWQHAGSSLLESDFSRPMIKVEAKRYQHSFSHLDAEGRATMVNVGSKPEVRRIASASGEIKVGQLVLKKIQDGSLTKGDVLSVSRLAGIMAAKQTSNLIPLCHQIVLDHVSVDIEIDEESGALVVKATVEARHSTGVEMEALTAVTVTLLSLYDMCKSVNKSMVISGVRLMSKSKS